MDLTRKHLSVLMLCALLAVQVSAQLPVLEFEQELDFDEPEAWAMKYFASASLLTSLGPVVATEAGQIDLGLELLEIPRLSQEERTVGFGGFKEEDLNRSPVWARFRLRLGLPRGFGLTLGWAPPVEVDGVEANLASLALEKSLWQNHRWGLGLRAYGQVGQAEGDFTCAAGGDERFPPGSPENPFGCEAPSEDQVDLDYFGLELVGHYRLAGSRSPTLHFGISWNSLDLTFQVEAQTFGFLDRTRLLADGETVALNAGATWKLSKPTQLGLELFYSSLEVDRGVGEQNDPLFNVRALLSYRLR